MILNKNDFTQQKYNELIKYANSNNCVIEDKGEYYETVEIEIIEPTLEELKQEKIKELKQNCQNYIYSVYPIYKQMNIINPLSDYSNEDRMTMNAFLDKQRAICNSKEEEINNAISKEELDNIQIKWIENE